MEEENKPSSSKRELQHDVFEEIVNVATKKPKISGDGLYIEALPKQITHTELREIFNNYGNLKTCHVNDLSGGYNSGCLVYENSVDAINAYQAAQRKEIQIDGVTIDVSLEETLDVSVKNSVNDEDKDWINILDDYSLIVIFSMLPITDRIRVKRVCKRWHGVGENNNWSNVKELTLPKQLKGSDKYVKYRKINNAVIKQVIGKCCRFLTSLNLVISSRINCNVLRYIKDCCPKITKLEIRARSYVRLPTYFAEYMSETLPNLDYLKLQNFYIRKNDMQAIMSNKNFVVLSFSQCSISREFYNLTDNMNHLKYLNLAVLPKIVTNSLLVKLIDDCPGLEYLNISCCNKVTSYGIRQLSNLPNLKTLIMSKLDKVSDRALSDLTKLETLICENCASISTPGLIRLILNAPNLQEINFYNCPVSGNLIKVATDVVRQRTNELPLFVIANSAVIDEWRSEQADSPAFQILEIN